MNHALLAQPYADFKVHEETHLERLRRLAAQADERCGTDVTDLSAAELIAKAHRA